jgi:hypothetical protein
MARIDWFARLAAAAARIDKAEAAADKAARALARVSRPETVRKYERQGKAAEARRRAAERDYREAERRLLPRERKRKEHKPPKRPPPPKGPPTAYMVTVDYRGRRGHTRHVEFLLHGPPGATASDVRRAVNGYAQRREPDGWDWSALRYGRTADTMSAGRVSDLSELQGLLMQERSITIGEVET